MLCLELADLFHEPFVLVDEPGALLALRFDLFLPACADGRFFMLGSLAAQNPSRYRADARQDRQQYNVCRGKIWHSLFPLHG